MQYGHVMASNLLDEDQLTLGLRADGIFGSISAIITGASTWVLADIGPFDPSIAGPIGGVFGAFGYLLYAINRNKKRVEQLAENEVLRKEMEVQFSSTLSDVDESSKFQEWDSIKSEITLSSLTEKNQKILERGLIVKHNLSEIQNLGKNLGKILDKLIALTEFGVKSSEENHATHHPRDYENFVEKEVAKRLNSDPEIVTVRPNVRIGTYIADFIVENKQNESFIVEVKATRDGEYPHALKQIRKLVSDSPYKISNDGVKSKLINLKNDVQCRIFVAKLISSEEE